MIMQHFVKEDSLDLCLKSMGLFFNVRQTKVANVTWFKVSFIFSTKANIANKSMVVVFFKTYFLVFCSFRFINARRRIVQPMIDQSNRAGKWSFVNLKNLVLCRQKEFILSFKAQNLVNSIRRVVQVLFLFISCLWWNCPWVFFSHFIVLFVECIVD